MSDDAPKGQDDGPCNYEVSLTASSIEVTASETSDARRYVAEDAGEFRAQWDYDLDEISPTDDDPTATGADASVVVDVDDAPGRGERTWTGSATFRVVVEAANDDEAHARALALLRA